MKRILFIASHLGSQVENLSIILEQHPKIQFYKLPAIYRHPSDLDVLKSFKHKCDVAGGIYATEILSNDSLAGRCLFKYCSFIYFIRRAQPTIATILANKLHNPKTALEYYIFRIRRIYEMAVQTPGSVFLTWDNIKNNQGLDLIQQYLGLKVAFTYADLFTDPENMVDQSYVKEADEAYEGILYRVKKLNLCIPDQ